MNRGFLDRNDPFFCSSAPCSLNMESHSHMSGLWRWPNLSSYVILISFLSSKRGPDPSVYLMVLFWRSNGFIHRACHIITTQWMWALTWLHQELRETMSAWTSKKSGSQIWLERALPASLFPSHCFLIRVPVQTNSFLLGSRRVIYCFPLFICSNHTEFFLSLKHMKHLLPLDHVSCCLDASPQISTS